jgi:predicted nucleic acid-binding protein
MKYLLDTNVISEHRRPQCHPRVESFMRETSNEDVFLSVVSVGEIVYGISRETDAGKKEKLSQWFDGLLELYTGKIFYLDADVMAEWGRLRARQKRVLPVMDSLIAATVLTHRLTLVTRNTRDFEDIAGISLVNPWEGDDPGRGRLVSGR